MSTEPTDGGRAAAIEAYAEAAGTPLLPWQRRVLDAYLGAVSAQTLLADLAVHLRRQLGAGERFVAIGDVLRRLGPAAGVTPATSAPAEVQAPEVAR